MNIRYRVELSEAERSELGSLLRGGQHAARKLKRAQILLSTPAGASGEFHRAWSSDEDWEHITLS